MLHLWLLLILVHSAVLTNGVALLQLFSFGMQYQCTIGWFPLLQLCTGKPFRESAVSYIMLDSSAAHLWTKICHLLNKLWNAVSLATVNFLAANATHSHAVAMLQLFNFGCNINVPLDDSHCCSYAVEKLSGYFAFYSVLSSFSIVMYHWMFRSVAAIICRDTTWCQP